MPDILSLDARLIWGIFTRLIGVVFLISFASLAGQVLPYAGSRGAVPVSRVLATIRRDFSPVRRWLHFPTLLWLDSSDRTLRALTWVGLAGAALVIWGGPLGSWGLVACYASYLSLDIAMALIFPWDCVLFEATLLALFLPESRALPELALVAAPAPALTWAYRALVFRVMFGFGKQKFAGSRRQDLGYLRGFLVNQPLPSKLGWYAQKLPAPLLQAAVLFMFVVEIPVAFGALVPGPASVACAVLTATLMVAIALLGTFGYFSLVTLALCVPLLDQATPLEPWLGSGPGASHALASAYVILHTSCAGFALLFNSWLGQSWHLWAYWYQLPRCVQPFFELLRTLHPLRWLHPYGVFPPNMTPPARMTLLFEVSWDDATWHPLEFPFSPVHARSAPRFIAPHHPRGDQALIYDTFGLNATSLMNGVIGVYSPYPYAGRLPLHFFCQAILRGEARGFVRGEALAAHASPPRSVRVTTHMLTPVSFERHLATGEWWRRSYVGPHVPEMQKDEEFWSDAFGEPELWHFEAIAWRRRSRLAALMREARRTDADPNELVIEPARGITQRDVERFWSELVPLLGGPARQSFDELPETVGALHVRFDREARRAQARLLGRLALCLVARLEPLYLHRGRRPLVSVPTYFHLWMLAHHVIGLGQEAFVRAFREPLSVNEHVPALTPHTGLFALAAFRFDEFCFEAQKLRLIEAFTYPHDAAAKRRNAERLRSLDLSQVPSVERALLRVALAVSGFFHVLSALRDGFKGPRFERGQPERYPEFVALASGEIAVHPHPATIEGASPEIASAPSRIEAASACPGVARARR